MRICVIFAVLVGILIAALAVQEAQLRRQLQVATAANHSLAKNVDAMSNRLDETQAMLDNSRLTDVVPMPPDYATTSNRIAALESRVQIAKVTALVNGQEVVL